MNTNLEAKLSILADAAKYDASCASSGTNKRDSRAGGIGRVVLVFVDIEKMEERETGGEKVRIFR